MSYHNKKLTYIVFGAHGPDYPKEDRDAIIEACHDLSDPKSSADFHFKDMYSGASNDGKKKESLLEDARKADVFFRLLYQVYGDNTKDEYEEAKRTHRSDAIYSFIRTDSEESKQLFESLKKQKNSGTIIEYTDSDVLRNRVRRELDKYRDSHRKTANRWWLLAVPIIALIIYLSSDYLNDVLHRERMLFNSSIDAIEELIDQKEYSRANDSLKVLDFECKDKWEQEKTRIRKMQGLVTKYLLDEHERNTFNLRLGNVKALFRLGKHEQARDSLTLLRNNCRAEWTQEKKAIDSLLSLSSPRPVPPGPIVTTNATLIEGRTFEVYGVQNPLRAGIVSAIQMEMPSLGKPSENKKEQWSITIEINPEFTEVPKIIESDEYMIDIEYSFSVKDNLAGKTVFENTFSTRGRSPASLEDAKKHSRQLAAHEIAQQIKQFIQ